MDGLGHLNRQIRQDPLVPVLRKMKHTVAWLDANLDQSGSQAANLVGQFFPRVGGKLISALRPQRRTRRELFSRPAEHLDKCGNRIHGNLLLLPVI
jgi:hypothetical protein